MSRHLCLLVYKYDTIRPQDHDFTTSSGNSSAGKPFYWLFTCQLLHQHWRQSSTTSDFPNSDSVTVNHISEHYRTWKVWGFYCRRCLDIFFYFVTISYDYMIMGLVYWCLPASHAEIKCANYGCAFTAPVRRQIQESDCDMQLTYHT